MQKKLSSTTVIKLLLAIFIGGYSSLSLELIVLRQLSSFVGTTTITVSIVMGCFLAFMSIGYYHGSIMSVRNNSIRQQSSKGFYLIALISILASSYILMDIYFFLLNALGININVIQTAIYSLVFLSYGPYLFGKITALLSRYLHYRDRNYTGKIMAVDTLGSVLGSLLTSLCLMPFIGVNYSILVLVVANVIGAFLVSRKHQYNYINAIILITMTYMLNRNALLQDIYNIVENNAVSTISIYDYDQGKSKIMEINRSLSSKISAEHDLNFPYINFINDNFVSTIPQGERKDILVVGAGGFTVGLNDLKNNYIYVDIDKELQKRAEEDFLHRKLSPNKKFIVQDANQFFKETTQKYDLIILDTYSSQRYIPQELITKEYFTRAKNALKDGGILVLNAIVSANFADDFSMNLDNTLRLVFLHNLRSQTVRNFNAWSKNDKANLMYVYYHHANPQKIYSINKNASFYDYEMIDFD